MTSQETAVFLHDPGDRPPTYPSLRRWTAGDGEWSLVEGTRMVLQGDDLAAARGIANLFAGDLETLTGRRPAVDASDFDPADHDIVLAIVPSAPGLDGDAYLLTVDDVIRVEAATRSGLLYGTQSILQILARDPSHSRVPRGEAHDWPQFADRGQMIDVGRKFLPINYLKDEIRRMAWMKMNTLHLHLTEWNGFRFASDTYPGLASAEHYTHRELRDLDRYASRYGVAIIPEIELPGHAVWLTHYDPKLRFPCECMDTDPHPGGTGGGWMIDVTSSYARTFAKNLIKELADVFSGPVIHIGGDELPLTDAQNRCPTLAKYASEHGMKYPGDVLVDFTNDLNETVRSLGRTTEIWEWWAFDNQPKSIAPDKNIRVDQWLGATPETWANEGYQTVGMSGTTNYVAPGVDTTPDARDSTPIEQVYESTEFPASHNIVGYRVARWFDKAEHHSIAWIDFFAQRPLQVLAERSWGGPRSATAAAFYERVDTIGGPPPNRSTVIPRSLYHVVEVSSEENVAEDGAVRHAFDGKPLTCWISKYTRDSAIGPHFVTIDLQDRYPIGGLRVTPRQDGKTIDDFLQTPARARGYVVDISHDGQRWDRAAQGELADERHAQTITFDPIIARYVRFTVTSDWRSSFIVAFADVSVLTTT